MLQQNILSKEAAQEKLHRMALEIAENISDDEDHLVLIGIEKSGYKIAEKLKIYIEKYHHSPIDALSVSFDKANPSEITLSKNIDFNDKNIILIDDVINSGKTFLYALKPLLDFRPKRIQTLAMIERMHKLFPIKPDYVGLSVATTATDNIKVIIEDGEIVGATFQ
ncbi:MAG TPA: phosphoribosyltransferase family protein [Arachidicoccus sp.]